jgi:hypothetical protein
LKAWNGGQVSLDCLGSVEEKYLVCFMVNDGTRGQIKEVQDFFKLLYFFHYGKPHKYIIIHILNMRQSLLSQMECDPFDIPFPFSSGKVVTPTLCQNDVHERRQRISLTETPRNIEGLGGGSINQDGEEGCRN